ncbi:MAG: bifunctional diaminohydroxyphosphoribosylaminopyrimidine deaminase/5-amino-6-(5-phosphoribosylamino)uracil reductase RibD [Propionibacteriaceae bacterium]|nr:bifunctional diaminohydroxyphosphoribosylaminopyrimidine deaminase/5-amino-6-(5-phosphoribosylamino)uracil reductase RibD [Propionibacteriaceae bacterium]
MKQDKGQQARPVNHLALLRALTLAGRGPAVDPNPRVGAVVTDGAGRIVGEGWHRGAGSPHAESAALAAAGDRARGGTVYVSLEPCCHTGRTGPCAQALIDAGITRVVYAQTDPNPVAHGGADRLRAAGVEVVGGHLAAEAEALNDAWTFAMRHGRPRVVWKTATSLDGRSAAADRTSRWITSVATRMEGHRLRAGCGAIMVGTGTAHADDPALTVRLDEPAKVPPRQPLRVVLGERELPPDAQLHDDAAPTLHLRHRDPAAALAALHDRGVRQVLLEGGPTLAAAFLRAGLVDRIVWHLAPMLLGAGLTLPDFGVGTLTEARRLVIREVRPADPDLIVVADVAGAPITN